MSNANQIGMLWQKVVTWIFNNTELSMPETFYNPAIINHEIVLSDKTRIPQEDVFERFMLDVGQLSRDPIHPISISSAMACCLLMQIQLAGQIPGNNRAYRQLSMDFAKTLEDILSDEFEKEEAELKYQEGELLREANRLESLAQTKQERRTYLEEITEKLGLKGNRFEQEPLPPPGQE